MSKTSAPPRRRPIGRASNLVEWVKVYQTLDALEIDHVTSFEIARRRLYFDEIVLVLLHRRGLRPLRAIVGGLIVVAALAAAYFRQPYALIPLALLFLLFLLTGVFSWTVTAFGRRTFARMRYGLRRRKAQTIYDEITRRAAEAQATLASRQAAAAPAPVADPWPAPPPPFEPLDPFAPAAGDVGPGGEPSDPAR